MFTKLLTAVAAQLRSHLVRLQCYLDDILIQLSSLSQAHVDLRATILSLQLHGFTVNMDKIQLVPSTRLLHLRTVIETVHCEVFLSQDRCVSIRALVNQVLIRRSVHLAVLSTLLGKLISCISIVPWAWLRACHLQWFLLPHQRRDRGIPDITV